MRCHEWNPRTFSISLELGSDLTEWPGVYEMWLKNCALSLVWGWLVHLLQNRDNILPAALSVCFFTQSGTNRVLLAIEQAGGDLGPFYCYLNSSHKVIDSLHVHPAFHHVASVLTRTPWNTWMTWGASKIEKWPFNVLHCKHFPFRNGGVECHQDQERCRGFYSPCCTWILQSYAWCN